MRAMILAVMLAGCVGCGQGYNAGPTVEREDLQELVRRDAGVVGIPVQELDAGADTVADAGASDAGTVRGGDCDRNHEHRHHCRDVQ